MGVISIEPATAQDAGSILALRHRIEEWLEARSVEQWGRGEVGLAEVQRQVAANEWQVVRSPAWDLRATLRLLWSEEPVWQHQNTFAAYVLRRRQVRHAGPSRQRPQPLPRTGGAAAAWVAR